MNRIVVVGYGPTAHQLVETLVDKGFDGRNDMIGRSRAPPTTGWR